MNREGRNKVSLVIVVLALGTIFGSFGPVKTEAAVNCDSLIKASNTSLSLTQLQQKQTCLSQLQSQYQTQVNQDQQQADSLQGAINSLDSSITSTNQQIDDTQDQIATTQAVLADLANQIKSTEQNLQDLNSKLAAAYDNVYELSQTSTLEMVLGSNSIDDLLSQTQYIEAIQSDLQANISKANDLKNNLSDQQATATAEQNKLQSFNDQLNKTKSSLSAQKNQKNNLLSQTQGDQAKYAQLVDSLKSEVNKVSAQIVQYRSTHGGFGSSTDVSGYPYAHSAVDIPDQWGFLTRECTSYAAYRVNGAFLRNPLPDGVPNGNAKYWPSIARARGMATGSTPRVGALVVWGDPGKYLNTNYIAAAYGHVAYVEAVGSGTITISQYNWAPYAYSEATVDPHTYGDPTYIYL